ncbi:MAG: hypothetical protein R3A10_16145 [Caldilineaceae bacterium]
MGIGVGGAGGASSESTIGDFVWRDQNANLACRMQRWGAGINGVRVELWLDDGDGVFERRRTRSSSPMLTGDDASAGSIRLVSVRRDLRRRATVLGHHPGRPVCAGRPAGKPRLHQRQHHRAQPGAGLQPQHHRQHRHHRLRLCADFHDGGEDGLCGAQQQRPAPAANWSPAARARM